MKIWLQLTSYTWCFQLLQRQIQFSELTEVVPIAEGGFGVIHRAKHHEWGTVVYKELKSSIIADDSKFVNIPCDACFLELFIYF